MNLSALSRSTLVLLAAFGSFALLSGAFAFQLAGYAPCQMCLWQRWPHAVAVALAAMALLLTRHQRIFAVLGALAAATTGLIGFYHTGVERNWWEGPSSCSGGAALQGDLLSLDIAPVVMCDDVVWSLFGLSMASYNALFSLLFVSIWIIAARR